MDTSVIYATIRQTVQTVLPGARVILFGSRARGEEDRYSDYDLLIITPSTISPREKIIQSTHLNNAIVKALEIPVDILINSEKEVQEKQKLLGHIVRTAVDEGVFL